MWPGFLAAQIVREYSLLLIFLCKIFPEKLDKARGGRRGILDSPFQSTPPRGGRLIPPVAERELQRISIHAPARGATRRVVSFTSGRNSISIHAPARGATRDLLARTPQTDISIHAPREGGDSKDAQFYLRIFDK